MAVSGSLPKFLKCKFFQYSHQCLLSFSLGLKTSTKNMTVRVHQPVLRLMTGSTALLGAAGEVVWMAKLPM